MTPIASAQGEDINTADDKTDVLLLSGFLGAGKTTLLKRILSWEADLSDTVVVVNEFGDVGIDGTLLKEAGSEVVELTSGCICCTLSSDLKTSLSRIRQRYNPRRIFVESSGVADPTAIVSVLGDRELSDHLVLNKIITVVDADFWEARENFGPLFFNQLERANLILLNKIDLIAEEKIPRFLQQIHDAMPDCQVIPTIRCRVDPESLWMAPEPKSADLMPMAFFAGAPTDQDRPWNDAPGIDPGHPTSVDAINYVTFSYTGNASFEKKRFERFVAQLPWELFRMKGPVRFSDRTEMVNYVGGKSEWGPWHGAAQTRLAFIGWKVDAEEILEKLMACSSEP